MSTEVRVRTVIDKTFRHTQALSSPAKRKSGVAANNVPVAREGTATCAWLFHEQYVGVYVQTDTLARACAVSACLDQALSLVTLRSSACGGLAPQDQVSPGCTLRACARAGSPRAGDTRWSSSASRCSTGRALIENDRGQQGCSGA
jgi:hypothetical protein